MQDYYKASAIFKETFPPQSFDDVIATWTRQNYDRTSRQIIATL